MRASCAAWAFAALVAFGLPASANEWHGGLAIRSDNGAGHMRAAAGVRSGALDVTLVLDPVGLFDQRQDYDLAGTWWFVPARFGLFLGHRTTTVGIADGRQYQQKVLLGLEAKLPSLGVTWARAVVGVELAGTWVRHGTDLPTSWVGFGDSREYSDLWNVNMLARIELTSGRGN